MKGEQMNKFRPFVHILHDVNNAQENKILIIQFKNHCQLIDQQK